VKRLLLLISLLSLSDLLIAQPYGNEWVDFSQTYLTFEIHENGIYRIDQQTLLQSGMPASVDPRSIQIFCREEEQAIYVRGEDDTFFDSDDFIEFYAEGNDGWLDQQMYDDPAHQPDLGHSLINDTIHYYLTWNGEANNLRMAEEMDTDFGSYSNPEYLWVTNKQRFQNDYSLGVLFTSDLTLPHYVEGEGWFSGRFGKNLSQTELAVELQSTNVASVAAPLAVGTSVTASATNASSTSNFNHHLRVYRGPSDNTVVADFEFNGYRLNKVEFDIPNTELGNGLFRVNHRVIDDVGADSDNHRLSYVQLEYPHSMDVSDLTNTRFEVPGNSVQNKHHVQLQNYAGSDPVIHVVNGTRYRISSVFSASGLNFIVPNQGLGQLSDCQIVEESDILMVPSLSPVNGSGNFTDYSAIDPDSAFVIVTHPSLMASANVYAEYRGSPGSGRDAVVVDVEELYHQFGGGIEKHPLAIRRFCDEILDSWTVAPAQLFLLGKSVYLDRNANVNGSRYDPFAYQQNLVPSFGSPQSDDLFTTGLIADTEEPAIPTGRLSAIVPSEVDDYLSKVVQHESEEPAIWMKNILHFGGGNSEPEQNAFKTYLQGFESVIEDTCFGGDVSTFLKTSSLPIEVNESQLISDIIEDGTSLITFFGHAGGSGFDVSIDDPENLDWGGYPLVLVNSCFSGDIHQVGHLSTSEDYVIIPNKGAIAFVAHVRAGLAGSLKQFSDEMYRQMSQQNYGQPIATQMQEVKRNLSPTYPNEVVSYGLALMTLQGDPAVSLHSHAKPDLAIDDNSVFFSPDDISAVVDSFTVHVVVDNIGKATTQPFAVDVTRTNPDGDQTVATKVLNGLFYRDTIDFTFPVSFATSFGLNTFDVRVDLPSNVVDELSNFSNNSVNDKPLLITDGGVYPVLPHEFAVIPDNQVTLKASSGNPFAPQTEFVFQLDTTDLFNSPMFMDYQVNQSGGVIEWQVPMQLTDSTVYYWRVSEDSISAQGYLWRESSFQYIEDKTGWGQAHFFQFEDNEFNNLVYDRPERDIDFFTGTKTLSAQVVGDAFAAEYFIDFNSVEYDGCFDNPNIHVAVVDPVTLEAWGTEWTNQDGQVFNPGNFFGNLNGDGVCRNRVEYYFIFKQNDPVQMQSMMDMINNEVPDGHYLLVYSWKYAAPSFWQPEIATFFNDDLGMTQTASLSTQVPFIGIGVKGDPSSFSETVGAAINSQISLEYDMLSSGNQGTMESKIAGPAMAWNSLHWDSYADDMLTGDSMHVKLVGITANGFEVDIPGATFDYQLEEVLDLSAYVDAAQYPFIRLEAFIEDQPSLTPRQLRRWQVLYDPVPEAALNPSIAFSFQSEEVQEGEQITLISSIENISSLDMDSLLVNYWVIDQSNVRHDIPYERQAPLLVGEHLTDTVTFSTIGFSGVNTIWVEANPYVEALADYDQLEQYHFNNIGQIKFEVVDDNVNPVLDVTFDGIHILDGEIVSTSPEILVRLDDENRFLIMDDPSDTTFFDVFLTHPNGFQESVFFRDGLGEEQMIFIPADGPDNIAQILYNPDLQEDGNYELMVIAADKSGNQSGDLSYRINFEVDSKASITDVMNYPNPFSTSTKFVFTLTGTEVPDYMKIQIMTVTGKVVKEIFSDELGALHIGRNITEYAWDGRDSFGDPLANGVYLYRVIVQKQGEDLEVRETASSQFFKEGFGKMYLMR
jgi:hypothetical protein